MISEIRFAGRSLRRRPGFAAMVVCTLAWGIGANRAGGLAPFFLLLRTISLFPSPGLLPKKSGLVEFVKIGYSHQQL